MGSKKFLHPSISAIIHFRNRSVKEEVFIYSGADSNFTDEEFVREHRMRIHALKSPLQEKAIDNHLISVSKFITEPIKIQIDNLYETLSFHVIKSPRYPVILGHPWLMALNPQLDWCSGRVLGWGSHCPAKWLLAAIPGQILPSPEVYPDLSKVPDLYHELKEVFNKVRAMSLPPHRPYDCAIDLLPGTIPHRGRLFSLRQRKKLCRATLMTVLQLASSSPSGAGFLFCKNKKMEVFVHA